MTMKTMSNVDAKTLSVTLPIAQFFTLRTFVDNARPMARIIVAEHYALNFFSTRLSRTALVATVIELALIASAPTSGASRIPKG